MKLNHGTIAVMGNAPKMETDSAVYKTLLESTKAIPWRIDWAAMSFTYIGPQIEGLLGWHQDSWKGVNDWAERMHPDDRERAVNFCVAQSQAGIDHEVDYRALTKDGAYVWIRDVVHVVRNGEGQVESLVGFMFDISERKKTEEQLLALQRELHELSFKDGLTGAANRRMFDTTYEAEWTSARRTRHPLSVILFDLDCFKQYNDTYGHIKGDECLKRIARLLGSAATRPRDLLARYGGEEFVVVLPETNESGALHVAERCRDAILTEQLPHATSTAANVVTVSIGVATIVPGADDDATKFVELVDQRLYQAKKAGRNRIVGG